MLKKSNKYKWRRFEEFNRMYDLMRAGRFHKVVGDTNLRKTIVKRRKRLMACARRGAWRVKKSGVGIKI